MSDPGPSCFRELFFAHYLSLVGLGECMTHIDFGFTCQRSRSHRSLLLTNENIVFAPYLERTVNISHAD